MITKGNRYIGGGKLFFTENKVGATEVEIGEVQSATLKIGVVMYFMMLPILALGCMGANSCYFVMNKVNQKKNMILF